MKGIILLNGQPYLGKIDTTNAFTVCCDGALNWAKDVNIAPDLCVGDFDSLGYIPDGAKVFPAEKDYTDGEIALDELIKRGADVIYIYGGGGGRDDHFLGNVGLLIKARELNVKAVMVTNYTEFCLVDGFVIVDRPVGTTVSMVPITQKLHINSSVGFKYPMSDLTVKMGESRGLSNVTTKEKAAIDIDCGVAILFVVREL